MRSNDLKERMLRQPSRFWLVLSIVLLLAGLGFLGAFGHAQYQYGKSGRYYARLQQTAADPDGGIDFAALQAINPDAAAWLEMPGLGISLPVVQAEADRVGSTVEVRDIDEDPALQADWDYDVPVIIVDGKVHARYRVDAEQLRTALRRRPWWRRLTGRA